MLLRRRFGRLGTNSYLSPLGIYVTPKQVFAGNDVYVGPWAMISASQGLFIGNGVIIGPQFLVMGGDHNFRQVGLRICEVSSGGSNQKVVIEDDVWIGARVTILKGVVVGEGAVVGAGSVVTRDVAPYTVVAGNPARKIGARFTRDELKKHLLLVNSKYVFEELEEYTR